LEIRLSGWRRNPVFGAAIVGLLILIMGITLYYFLLPGVPALEPIPAVPPSSASPDYFDPVETIQAGSLIMNATANATGVIPHYGPMFFKMTLVMNITNNGSEDITDFQAVKVSVYSNDNELFYTFGFLNDSNVTIPAGESVSLSYQNNQTRVEYPFEPWRIYARVLVTFDVNREVILTAFIGAIYALE
jgi:hypothetical protein